MLLTPEGQPADTIDRIMLLAMWAMKLQQEIHLASAIFLNYY
jgi:hypothetical protein